MRLTSTRTEEGRGGRYKWIPHLMLASECPGCIHFVLAFDWLVSVDNCSTATMKGRTGWNYHWQSHRTRPYGSSIMVQLSDPAECTLCKVITIPEH